MTVRVLQGHVLDVLRGLPSNTFQCVATSPPYYGLRDYGLPPQVWGGEPGHEHEWAHESHYFDNRKAAAVAAGLESKGSLGGVTPGVRVGAWKYGWCACGAWLGSLGLEPTPELYVEHLVSVFREVRRVLRPDGVCWVNLGDSYAGSGKGQPGVDGFQPAASQMDHVKYPGLEDDFHNVYHGATDYVARPRWPKWEGCKPKDLLGMPWMVAFALRADGWYLRADIIWSKPNPMPESVTDRPTKAHEYVFLLSKSRTYFYDADAIREEARYGFCEGGFRASGRYLGGAFDNSETAVKSVTVTPGDGGSRNKRSVWEIATAPFPNAHFATWPPKLVEPMLLAGSRPGDHVLDPFGGAGTTGLVADRLGRDCTLIELNPAYADMARERITDDAPLFAEVVA